MSASPAFRGPAIGDIPLELTSEIFLLVVCHLHHDPVRYHLQLEILSQVSWNWKTIVDTTPELWSIVHYRHTQKIAQMYLDKSRRHALDIHLVDFSAVPGHVLQIELVLELLLPQVDRIHALELNLHTSAPDLSPTFISFLKAALPRLASLSLFSRYGRLSLTSYAPIKAPNVRTLHLHCMSLEPHDLLMFPSLQELHVQDNRFCDKPDVDSVLTTINPGLNQVGLPRLRKVVLYRLVSSTLSTLLHGLRFPPTTELDITLAVNTASDHPSNFFSQTREIMQWALANGDPNPHVTIEIETNVTRFRFPSTTLSLYLGEPWPGRWTAGAEGHAYGNRDQWHIFHSELKDAYGNGPLTLIFRGPSTNATVFWDQYDKAVLTSRVEHIVVENNEEIWHKLGMVIMWIIVPDVPSVEASGRQRWHFPNLQSWTYVAPESHKERLGEDLEKLYERLVRRGTTWDGGRLEASKIPSLSILGTEKLTPQVRAELQRKLEMVVGRVVLG